MCCIYNRIYKNYNSNTKNFKSRLIISIDHVKLHKLQTILGSMFLALGEFTSNSMDMVCKDVASEPVLQDVEGEQLT